MVYLFLKKEKTAQLVSFKGAAACLDARTGPQTTKTALKRCPYRSKRRRLYHTEFLTRETPYGTASGVSTRFRTCFSVSSSFWYQDGTWLDVSCNLVKN
jgi:hypothetical protein